jgi:hypothetical protein
LPFLHQPRQPEETRLKLTPEQHAQIALHLHAADRHLLKALQVMVNPMRGEAYMPIEIVERIEEVRETVGAATSFSRHSIGSISHRCEEVLFNDWPGSTFETYRGSYAMCATYQPTSEDPIA